MKTRSRTRGAFTLLELILALSIGLVLLVALYLAMDTQIQHAQIGREVADQAALARVLLNRIAGDIVSHLGPASKPPSSQPSSSSTTSDTTNTSSSSSSSSTSSSSTDSSSSSDSSTSSSTTTTTSATITCNVGVQGEGQRLVLTVSRVPRDPSMARNLEASSEGSGESDLRRISYWLVEGDGPAGGLARQELTRVTSEEADTQPPDVAEPASYLIASEVIGLSFQYFDGTAWVDSWDGSATGEDGQTPIGPPMAIAISLTLANLGSDRGTTYRHVVAIPTANGLPAQNQGVMQP